MRNGTRYAAYAVDEELKLVNSRALKQWVLPAGQLTDKKVLEAAIAWSENYVQTHQEIAVEVWVEEFVDQKRDWREQEWRACGKVYLERVEAWHKEQAAAGR